MLTQATLSEQDAILAFLKKDPEINLFMIADLEFYGMEKAFIKVWHDGMNPLKTILLKYHHNMILYSTGNDYDKQDLEKIIDNEKVVFFSCGERSFDYLHDLLETKFHVWKHTLARMRHLIPQEFPLMNAKKALPEDAEGIAKSMLLISEFKDFMIGTLEERSQSAKEKIQNGFCVHFIIKENNIVIANANTSALCSVAAMIGGVYTLSEYRNKGYGTSVVYHLCRYLLQKKIIPMLFFENPKASSIYHALGFEDIGFWMVCRNKDK